MFVRKKIERSSIKIQICESTRTGSVVSQKILRHVASVPLDADIQPFLDIAEHIKLKIEQQRQLQLFDMQTMLDLRSDERPEGELVVDLAKLREQERYTIGIHDIYGELYDGVGFQRILPSCRVSGRVLRDIVMARLSSPCSKRASVDILDKDFGIRYSLEQVYRMMDRLDTTAISRLQGIVWNYTKTLLDEDALIMFYDCTTLHFESFTADELRDFGFSKAHLGSQTQVLLALMVTKEGLPMGYEVFSGSVYEGHTLRSAIEGVKQRYGISRAIVVADSALLSEDNIADLQSNGLEYVVGARLKSLPSAWQEKVLGSRGYKKLEQQGSGGKDIDILRIGDFDYKGQRRLIVSHSMKRADKDRHDRDKALEKIRKQLKASKNPKDIIRASGGKKYIRVVGDAQLTIDEEKVQRSIEWDGLHGVFTNIYDIDAMEILSHYRGLWQVEESFRIGKQDIAIRPIFHWTKRRIEAHLAVCYMAFALIRFMQDKLRRAKVHLSPDRVKQTLNRVQKSILRHIATEQLYVIPSKLPPEAKEIYNALRRKYNLIPYLLKPPD